MPKMEKVYLHNPSSEEISLISISATTAHFHASFFQNRVSRVPYFTSLMKTKTEIICFILILYFKWFTTIKNTIFFFL